MRENEKSVRSKSGKGTRGENGQDNIKDSKPAEGKKNDTLSTLSASDRRAVKKLLVQKGLIESPSRKKLLKKIREEIKSGTYETSQKLNVALDRMIDRCEAEIDGESWKRL